MLSPSLASSPFLFAELWPRAAWLARQLGLERIHIVDDLGRPVARFRRIDGIGGRIDPASELPPGEPAVNLAFLFAASRRRSSR